MQFKDDSMKWIPLWIDKWLFGSTRLELQHDERAIWVDLMAIAGKDNGFIRANPHMPYRHSQIAGLLCAPEELVLRTIKRCIETGKIIEQEVAGIYYLVNWKEFKLNERQKMRILAKARRDAGLPKRDRGRPKKTEDMSLKNDITTINNGLKKSRVEKSIEENSRVNNNSSPIYFECEFFKIENSYHEELFREFPLINLDDLYVRLRNDCHDNPLRYKKNVHGYIKNLRNVIRNWCQREKPIAASPNNPAEDKPKSKPKVKCQWCGIVYYAKEDHRCAPEVA